ncbi:MAG: LysM domain/BON superfamily protein [Firmicutes bacterium ADurb.Bin300]|nr:MAG: LysM domain/BON superfamily protein [Firmicutes bacterium ADurb.Bin300]
MNIILMNSIDFVTADIYFPMLPEEINVETATRFQTYDIMSVGEIKLPLGEELTGFSWSGILPGKNRKGQAYITGGGYWMEPLKIQQLLSFYRVNGTKLRLIVTDTPINHYVYLADYKITYKGKAGDYFYDISFIVAKDLKVIKESSAGTAIQQVSTASNTNRPAPQPSSTYTVKAGDSLWKIAQTELSNGSRYPEIYSANQQLIDSENAKRKVRDKYTIYPGQVLTIPR